MLRRNARITLRSEVTARAVQALYPLLNRALLSSPKVEFATKRVGPPTRVRVPTRYGAVDALVFAPLPEDLAAHAAAGRRPPVHVIIHGGAFILQRPSGEGNVARYLASELGCYVVMPDYRAAPQVLHPVAEHECFDTYTWVRAAGETHGWDGTRVSVGGPSAGGHLALQVALAALDTGVPVPTALSVEFAPMDMSLPNADRTSPVRRPVIGPFLMDLVKNTYFAGADLASPAVSPAKHPSLAGLPPTLVIVAAHDTLRPEAERFAAHLESLGVEVTYRLFDGVDHGFTARPPAGPAREAITAMGRHLQHAYDRPAEPLAG
ncbi:alpha/beta hydrolase fold domain-containing protein [Streptomyces sp. NPDC055681]